MESSQRNRRGLTAQLGSGWRQVQRVFHVLIGAAFLVLAAEGAAISWAEWQVVRASPARSYWEFGMFAGFTLLLLIFGLYSIAKARHVR